MHKKYNMSNLHYVWFGGLECTTFNISIITTMSLNEECYSLQLFNKLKIVSYAVISNICTIFDRC